eukprot:jgi/Undpi1/865/HiC_scaffold_10.g04329.m1
MSFLKELTDKGATIAWSNVAAHPGLIALGTKDSGGGSGFDDYGGELELHKLDFSRDTDGGGGGGGSGGGGSAAGTLLGKVKTSTRFAALAWSEMATKQEEYPYGLIAGGMSDGTVNVWDPAKLVASHPQPQVTSVQRHAGPVTGLHFNPHKASSHLLASGGADSEVFIMALDRPDTPNVFVPGPKPNTSRSIQEVTTTARPRPRPPPPPPSPVPWNKVSHIMATAAQNGSCIVWDLKQKKPWCELRDPNRAPITDVAWNPDQGQHIVTASGDDNNPVLKLWDLRSSTTLPLATLAGHTEGVLSVAWCPYGKTSRRGKETGLLMSCAKDNRTLLWDLFSLKPVYELAPGGGADVPVSCRQGGLTTTRRTTQMFGGYGKTAQRRYQVSWSPHIPAVIGTCSFDRKVQVFSMNGASTDNGRAPKWHRRPAGASFGFGGKLIAGSESAMVKISLVKEDPAFVAASRRFEEAMASQGFRGFCQEKEASAASAHEKRVWQFMQVIFEKNARHQLLAHLGFDGETVARQAAEFVAASAPTMQNGSTAAASSAGSPKAEGNVLDDDEGGDESDKDSTGGPGETELAEAMDAVDLGGAKAGGGLFSEPAPLSAGPPAHPAGHGFGAGGGKGGMSKDRPLSKAAEAVIKRSLLVGNFEAAVQCCMSTGNMADAMLLASCGGADLWAKTQAQYFARESHRRPFLRVVNAIIKSELGGLVEASDLAQWQETLAILSTYAKQNEFPTLCEALASRLETEAGDRKSANLCYMCAVKVPKTVEMWAEELRAANAAVNGGTDTKALQEFVEKVAVFTQEPNDPPGDQVAEIFAEYAGFLASEGERETALKYIRGQGGEGAVLLDRLYHAAPHAAGSAVPAFPFERVRVGVSPQSVVGGAGAGAGAAAQGGRGANGTGTATAAAASRGVNPRAAGGGGGSTLPAAGGGDLPLPQGWAQMMDPQRRIPYYCNTVTGETQWERPPPPPLGGGGGAGVERGVPGNNVADAAPASGARVAAAAAAPPPPPDAESQAVVSALNGMLGALSETPLSPSEKKMLGDVTKAVSVLFAKMGHGQVERATLDKVGQLVKSLETRDMKAANAIQQGLANSVWQSHKDWLKGLKYLMTLVSRRL